MKLKSKWESIYNRFKDAHLVRQDEIWLGRRRGSQDDDDESEEDESNEVVEGNGRKDKKGRGKGKGKRLERKDEEMRIIRDRGTLRGISGQIQFGDFIKLEEEEVESNEEESTDQELQNGGSKFNPSYSDDHELPMDSDEDELGQDNFLLDQYTEFNPINQVATHQEGIRFGFQEQEEDEQESLEKAMRLNPDLREFLEEERKRREILGLDSDGDDEDELESEEEVIDFGDPEWETGGSGSRKRNGEDLESEEEDKDEENDLEDENQVNERGVQGERVRALSYDSDSEDELDVLVDDDRDESSRSATQPRFKSTTLKSKTNSHLNSNDLNPSRSRSKSNPPSSYSIPSNPSQYDYLPPEWLEKRSNVQDLLDSDSLNGSMIPFDETEIPGLKELLDSKDLTPAWMQGRRAEVGSKEKSSSSSTQQTFRTNSTPTLRSTPSTSTLHIPSPLTSRQKEKMKDIEPTNLGEVPKQILDRIKSGNGRSKVKVAGIEKGKSKKIHGIEFPLSPPRSHSPHSDRLDRSSSLEMKYQPITSSSTSKSNKSEKTTPSVSRSKVSPSNSSLRKLIGTPISNSYKPSSINSNRIFNDKVSSTSKKSSNMISPPGTPTRSSSTVKSSKLPSSSGSGSNRSLKRKRIMNLFGNDDFQDDEEEEGGGVGKSSSNVMGSSPCGSQHGIGKCQKAFCFSCLSVGEE